MIATAHPTPPSAAASAHAPARRPLELLEARQQRDALEALLRKEQSAMADFLVALADFDLCRGWEALGHASLFAFVRVELGLSRSGAYWRLSAARLVQRFPQVIDPLRDGRLCMSTTAELSKVLTEENRAEVLPRFYGLSAREAQEVTAELAPRQVQPARDVVTRLEPDQGFRLVVRPVPATERLAPSGATVTANSAATAPPTSMATPTGESVQTFGLHSAAPAPIVAPPARDDVEPLSADLRRLHVTVSRQLLKKLEAAREGLSHAIPGATTDQVIEAALDLLLEKQARARGQVRRPRAIVAGAVPAPVFDGLGTASLHRRTGTRETIPAAVRRAVWERDQGRCSWPLDSGGVCGSTHRLELDHVKPWARDGEPTVANLRVVCHVHNTLAARLAFGARCVESYRSGRRA